MSCDVSHDFNYMYMYHAINVHVVDISLHITVEPLYCPDYRGVLISEVGLYGNVVVGNLVNLESVLIVEVSLFQGSIVYIYMYMLYKL